MLKRAFVAVMVAAVQAAPLAAQSTPPAPVTESSAPAAVPPVTDTLTADEIVTLNLAARGGLQAWRSVRAMRMSGVMDVGKGKQAPFTLQLKRARKMRLEFLFDGQMVVQAYDGRAGWKRQPYLGKGGYELMTADELRGAAGQAELDGPLVDYKAKGYTLEVLGREQVEGHDAVKLAVTLGPGVVRHLYLDAETWLEVKVDGSRKLRGQDHKVETFFRDYRRVDGVVVAHTVETRFEGASKANAMKIEKVEVNPPLDEALFAPPAS